MALKKINDDVLLRLIREGNSSAEAARYLIVFFLSLIRFWSNPRSPYIVRLNEVIREGNVIG